ncbi:MAG: carboxypeptidase-like regulatory domain-containing protein [Flavobacteriales bacterium]
MIKKIILTFIGVLTVAFAFAQPGTGQLKGTITDKSTGETLPFVNLVLIQNGTQKAGAASDLDGKFVINAIQPGSYELKVSFVGYKKFQANGILIKSNKITFQDVLLETGDVTLEEFTVIDYEVPLIDKDGGSSGGTMTQEEIAKMPGRDAGSIAATVGGVQTDGNGAISSVRGSRSDATFYYIDGIKVRGSINLPKAAIQEVAVITGGQPASIGDATGGVISITTRGPSNFYFGGLEYVTSGYKIGDNTYGLDNYGYNLAEGFLSGPLFMKRDSTGKKTKPILGFFISGNARHIVDSRPLAIDQFQLKQDVKDDILANPVVRNQSNGVNYKTEFLTMNDFEEIKFRQNAVQRGASISSKIDVNTGPNINLSFGGTLDWSSGNGYNFASALLNSDNLSNSSSNTWRAYGKLTQRFENNISEEGNEGSKIKNAYYTVMVDYSRTSNRTRNNRHGDNLFDYGHVGEFDRQFENNYEFDEELNTFIHNGFRETSAEFTGSEKNSDLAAVTQQFYNFNDGFVRSIDNVLQGQALRNGDVPRSVYGLFTNVGVQPGAYSYGDFSQFRVTASGSANVGDHALTLGFEYEQRADRSYGINPVGLWQRMRQLANSHINELDLANFSDEYRGTYLYRTYDRLISSESQTYFDFNLRNSLGLDPNGSDFIVTDALDPSQYSVDFFSADELTNGGFDQSLISYFGYDHTGKRLSSNPSLDDFFTATDEFGNFKREVGAFEPIYFAGFIMDKFAFNDIIFNVGLRIDRFDANQSVLKDRFLLRPARTAAEVGDFGAHPSNIGDDFIVYVNDINAPTAINGYRNGNTWYNADGIEITDPKTIESPNGIAPYLAEGVSPTDQVNSNAFEDYTPAIVVMPRISFSFPISEDALFFAHYDILSQRPTQGNRLNPLDYLYIDNISADVINNPNLKPTRTIDYEVGFQQVLSRSSSLKIAGFYREQRDEITVVNVAGAYPKTYRSFGNLDFGTVKGMTLTYDKRKSKNLWMKLSYTLQFAEGTGSSAGSSLALINSGQPNLRAIFPYTYDQRHQVTGTIDFRYGQGKDYNGLVLGGRKILENTGVNFTGNFSSGRPYSASKTVQSVTGIGASVLEGTPQGSRNPGTFRVDMQIDRNFMLKFGAKKQKSASLNVYLLVNNLFNTQNILGVYRATGNPDDDGFLSDAQFQNVIASQISEASFREYYALRVNNPFNFSIPRTIRIGVKLDF